MVQPLTNRVDVPRHEYCSALLTRYSGTVTLMSADTERICSTAALLHEVWASPIECGIAVYLLYTQLGAAAWTPIVVVLGWNLALLNLTVC